MKKAKASVMSGKAKKVYKLQNDINSDEKVYKEIQEKFEEIRLYDQQNYNLIAEVLLVLLIRIM